MAPKVQSERAKTSRCVRCSDGKGWSVRLNRTRLSSLQKVLFYYLCKCYEKLLCGQPLSDLRLKKKLGESWSVLGRLAPPKPLPEEFESLNDKEKGKVLKGLILGQLGDFEINYRQCEGANNQANHPDNVQVDGGCGADPHLEGDNQISDSVGNLQNLISSDVGGYPQIDFGGYPQNRLDNPEGRPPPSSGQYPNELDQIMIDYTRRASRYPDLLQEWEPVRQLLSLYLNKLEWREIHEPLLHDPESSLSRRSLEEIPSKLPEGALVEDP